MEELWPEYLGYSRIPYQEIGYRVAGRIMKYFVALNIDVCITCSLFNPLITDSLESIVYNYVRLYYILKTVTAILLPFSMNSSYKDMKYLAVIDAVYSLVLLFLLIVCLPLDKPLSETVTYKENDFTSFIVSLGGFSFAYGSGPVLSNIMMDMEDRTMYIHSCATGYLVVILIYITTAIIGYVAYGDTTTPCILQKILTNESFRSVGIVIDITCFVQLMATFVLFLLPSLLQFEARLNCPDRFDLGRVLVRFILVACMLLATWYCWILGNSGCHFNKCYDLHFASNILCAPYPRVSKR